MYSIDIPNETGQLKDVSVKKIKERGLCCLLRTKVPLAYFLLFTLHDHCSENLPTGQLERAKSIYEIFVASGAPLEININEWVKLDIENAIASCTNSETMPILSNLFDVAQRNVYDSLLGTFPKWKSHLTFKLMQEDLGEENEIYSREHRRKAASRLLEYFDQERCKSTLSRQFCEKFYWLTGVFCKNEIGLEFLEENNQPLES